MIQLDLDAQLWRVDNVQLLYYQGAYGAFHKKPPHEAACKELYLQHRKMLFVLSENKQQTSSITT